MREQWELLSRVLVQRNGRASGLQKGGFQFLVGRNQMLAGKRSNARRFARSGEKATSDLEKVSGDVLNGVKKY
jgi:hypothetical protein